MPDVHLGKGVTVSCHAGCLMGPDRPSCLSLTCQRMGAADWHSLCQRKLHLPKCGWGGHRSAADKGFPLVEPHSKLLCAHVVHFGRMMHWPSRTEQALQLPKGSLAQGSTSCACAGCGMCAVPVDGLHKEDVSHEQLVKIQQLLKRRIPTGTNAALTEVLV